MDPYIIKSLTTYPVFTPKGKRVIHSATDVKPLLDARDKAYRSSFAGKTGKICFYSLSNYTRLEFWYNVGPFPMEDFPDTIELP